MNRREFLKRSFKYLLTGGVALKLGGIQNIFSAEENKIKKFDLVAVKGDDIKKMFIEGIKYLGGIKKYVKKGQTVAVKPNIGWNKSPEQAANTNPELIAQIVKSCYSAGAQKVFVFDHTCDSWRKAYKTSGIMDAAKNEGAIVLSANFEKDYKKVSIPKAKILKSTKVFKYYLSADVIINVPVLKHHGTTRLTIAMKNLMGVVWDRWIWHATDLNQSIADFIAFRKPDLNVIDAYRVLTRNGPRGVSEEDVVLMKTLILSDDIVAADASAALLFGEKPENIKHIKIAYEKNLGNIDLQKLNIKRIIL